MERETLYTIKQAAALTGKAPVTVRQLVRAHGLGMKIGRDWLLTYADVQAVRDVPKPGHPPGKMPEPFNPFKRDHHRPKQRSKAIQAASEDPK